MSSINSVSRLKRTLLSVILLVIALNFAIITVEARYPTYNWNFDIQGVKISPTTLTPGDTLHVTVTIKNTGRELGTVKLYLGIKKPDGTRIYPDSAKIYDIPVGGSKSTTLSWSIPTSERVGTYYVCIDVYNPPEDHLFDTTGFVYSFKVEQSKEDKASIISFSPPSGTFKPGDAIVAKVTIKNTGTTTRSFWVGLSYKRPDGGWYHVSPKQTGTLSPGETTTITFSYVLPSNAPKGWYDAVTAIWNDYDSYRNKMIEPRFDSEEKNDVFKIEHPKLKMRVWTNKDTLEVGEELRFGGKVTDDEGDPVGDAKVLIYNPLTWSWYYTWTASNGEFSYSVYPDESGTFTFKFKAEKDGYVSSNEVSYTITVKEHENRPPKISKVYPSGSSIEVKVGETIEFKVKVEDPDGNLDKVVWFVNGEDYTTHYISDSSDVDSLSYTFRGDEYVIDALVYDKKGAYSSVVKWFIEVRKELPKLNVELVSPEYNTIITSLPIKFKVRVTSNCYPVENAKVTFYYGNGGTGVIGSAYTDSNGYASITGFYSLSSGSSVSWWVKAEKSGYTSTTSDKWKFTYQPAKPKLNIQLISPSNGTTVTTLPITFKVRVTSGGKPIEGAKVKLTFRDGGTSSSGWLTTNSSGYATYTGFSSLAPGSSLHWYAEAYKEGYESEKSETWYFRYKETKIHYPLIRTPPYHGYSISEPLYYKSTTSLDWIKIQEDDITKIFPSTITSIIKETHVNKNLGEIYISSAALAGSTNFAPTSVLQELGIIISGQLLEPGFMVSKAAGIAEDQVIQIERDGYYKIKWYIKISGHSATSGAGIMDTQPAGGSGALIVTKLYSSDGELVMYNYTPIYVYVYPDKTFIDCLAEGLIKLMIEKGTEFTADIIKKGLGRYAVVLQLIPELNYHKMNIEKSMVINETVYLKKGRYSWYLGGVVVSSALVTPPINGFSGTWSEINIKVEKMIVVPASAENILLQDDFEGYSSGTFPSSGGWKAYFNAISDPNHNIITDATSYSGSKSLQVYGSHSGCWAALVAHDLPKKDVIYIEASMKASGEAGGGCHKNDIQLGLGWEIFSWGHHWKPLIAFKSDKKIYGVGGVLQDFTPNKWYKIKIKLDLTKGEITYWIDGNKIATRSIDPFDYSYLAIESGDGKGWIDDVKIYYENKKLYFTERPSNKPIEVTKDNTAIIKFKVGYGKWFRVICPNNVKVVKVTRNGHAVFSGYKDKVDVCVNPGDRLEVTIKGVSVGEGLLNYQLANSKEYLKDYPLSSASDTLFADSVKIVVVQSKPKISIIPEDSFKNFDFGKVKVGNSERHEVVIKNEGNAPLKVTSIELTCKLNCEEDEFRMSKPLFSKEIPFTVDPGKYEIITITFKPKTEGYKETSLIVRSNDPERPRMEKTIKGIGVDWIKEVKVEPSYWETYVGEIKQFTAYAHYASGKEKDVTYSAEWSSSNPNVVRHIGNGKFKAVRVGEATITVKYNGVTDTAQVNVTVGEDWNPWNDSDSDGGEKITTAELQEAIHCWLNDEPAPKTGAKITTERLQEVIHLWLQG